MSSGVGLRPTPPPLFRPEGLQAAPRVGSQACRKSRAPCFSLVGRRASPNAGANVLGGKIKEEASAEGRRRGTFAPKGIRTRAQPTSRRSTFPSREKNLSRSKEHTSELQSLMRISYTVFCLKTKQTN